MTEIARLHYECFRWRRNASQCAEFKSERYEISALCLLLCLFVTITMVILYYLKLGEVKKQTCFCFILFYLNSITFLWAQIVFCSFCDPFRTFHVIASPVFLLFYFFSWTAKKKMLLQFLLLYPE